MRLDEMIIKANADGKTYVNGIYGEEYSADKGFICESEPINSITSSTYIHGWQEKPKRHLTVSEAEKELDCVIDAPDISKLFISSDILPEDGLKVILLYRNSKSFCCSGYYDATEKEWRLEHSGALVKKPTFYIKQSTFARFLPKE